MNSQLLSRPRPLSGTVPQGPRHLLSNRSWQLHQSLSLVWADHILTVCPACELPVPSDTVPLIWAVVHRGSFVYLETSWWQWKKMMGGRWQERLEETWAHITDTTANSKCQQYMYNYLFILKPSLYYERCLCSYNILFLMFLRALIYNNIFSLG